MEKRWLAKLGGVHLLDQKKAMIKYLRDPNWESLEELMKSDISDQELRHLLHERDIPLHYLEGIGKIRPYVLDWEDLLKWGVDGKILTKTIKETELTPYLLGVTYTFIKKGTIFYDEWRTSLLRIIQRQVENWQLTGNPVQCQVMKQQLKTLLEWDRSSQEDGLEVYTLRQFLKVLAAKYQDWFKEDLSPSYPRSSDRRAYAEWGLWDSKSKITFKLWER